MEYIIFDLEFNQGFDKNSIKLYPMKSVLLKLYK